LITDFSKVAVVLAAHGDRGSTERNAVLSAHAARLRDKCVFASVSHGVLNGEPQLTDVLGAADSIRPELLLVYPFFMSGGYFAKSVIPSRIASVALSSPLKVLEPLGLDPALPGLLLRRALRTADESGFKAEESLLLIAAHGSKVGRASAETANAIAAQVRTEAPFASVATAFIEEPPFIEESLRETKVPAIVAGLFSGDGMHGHHDVTRAMQGASVPCAYTRPIGSDPEVTVLIETSIYQALRA
jgi:sirohydrochlorin ferrochelatase